MEVDELAEDYEDEEDFYSSPHVHASSRNSRHGNGHMQGEGYRNGVREEVAVTARGHPFHQFLPEPFPAPLPSKEIEDDSPRAVPSLPPAAAQTTVRRSASVSTSRPGTAGDTANGPRPRPSISTSSSASAQPASAPPRSVPLLPPHLPSMHLPPSMMNSSIPPALLPPSLPSPPPGPPLQQKVMQDGRHYGALRPPGDSPLGYFKTPDGREFYFAEGVRMDRESFWQYFGYN
ncbi:hypothetical protein BT69DRAFT_783123 [Atractiella rhizophila]|nr:hypothetical protein BT69DRAFT_783123 [Atractiella rhizophila]